MNDALFSYGTLQIPEVMHALTGHAFPWVEGKAHGYARFCFSDRMYPGMVAREGAITPGRVYTALTRQIWKILDQFEDPVYQRELIDVDKYDGQRMQAYAYVLPAAQQHLLSNEVWRLATFVDAHLSEYVDRCRLFYKTITS